MQITTVSPTTDDLDRVLKTLPAPVLLLSSRAGRGNTAIAAALAERLEDRGVHQLDMEAVVPPEIVREDTTRYRWICEHCPSLLHLVYRIPLFYYGKLWLQRRRGGTFLHNLDVYLNRRRIAAVIGISHRPTFWAAVHRKKSGHLAQVLGFSTDYGPSLGWRYQFWDVIDGFLSAVAPASLKLTLPADCRFHPVAIPARRRFEQLRQEPGNRDEVLLTGGLWGLGGLDSVLAQLANTQRNLTIHLVCGENRALYDRVIRKAYPTITLKPYGLQEDLSVIMGRCASVLTKPGTASLAEAHAAGRQIFLLKGLPVAEENNARFAVARLGARPFSAADFCAWLDR